MSRLPVRLALSYRATPSQGWPRRTVRHVATVTRSSLLQDLAMLGALVVLACCIGAMAGLGVLSCFLAVS